MHIPSLYLLRDKTLLECGQIRVQISETVGGLIRVALPVLFQPLLKINRRLNSPHRKSLNGIRKVARIENHRFSIRRLSHFGIIWSIRALHRDQSFAAKSGLRPAMPQIFKFWSLPARATFSKGCEGTCNPEMAIPISRFFSFPLEFSLGNGRRTCYSVPVHSFGRCHWIAARSNGFSENATRVHRIRSWETFPLGS